MRGHSVGGWWPQQTNRTSSSPAGVSQVDGYFSVQSLLADRACVPGSQSPPRSKANRRGRPQDVVGVPGWAGQGRAGQGRAGQTPQRKRAGPAGMARRRQGGLAWLGPTRRTLVGVMPPPLGTGALHGLGTGQAGLARAQCPRPPADGSLPRPTCACARCGPPAPRGLLGAAASPARRPSTVRPPRDLPPETALRSLPGACSLRRAARREMGAPRAPPRAWPGGSLVCPRGGVALVESVHVLYQRVDLPQAPRGVPPGPPTRPSAPWG